MRQADIVGMLDVKIGIMNEQGAIGNVESISLPTHQHTILNFSVNSFQNDLTHELKKYFDADQFDEINRICKLCGIGSIEPAFSYLDYLHEAVLQCLNGKDYDAIRYYLWQCCTYHPDEIPANIQASDDEGFFR